MDYTEQIEQAGRDAGLSAEQIAAIITRCGRRDWMGSYRIANRGAETAARMAVADAKHAAAISEPAVTERQADYITALGGQITPGMSRREASALIDTLKARRLSSPAAQARATGARYGVHGEVWD